MILFDVIFLFGRLQLSGDIFNESWKCENYSSK